jgi:hypothetical protein
MADTAARVGYGVILKKGDGGSPEAYTDYGLEVTSVSGVGFSRSAIDATHMQSADGYVEFIHGLKTTKPITVELNWLATNTASIQALLEGAKGNWRVQFPDNSTMTFKAAITDFDLGSVTPDGKMTASMVFTPSGKATLA